MPVMSDTDRILEAIGTLTQQISNLEHELAGLRNDVQHMNAGQELSKKKWTNWSSSSTPLWLNWQSSAPGETIRRGGSAW